MKNIIKIVWNQTALTICNEGGITDEVWDACQQKFIFPIIHLEHILNLSSFNPVIRAAKRYMHFKQINHNEKFER